MKKTGMKKFRLGCFFILVFTAVWPAVFFMAGAAHAEARACPDVRPEVNVKSLTKRTKFSHEKSISSFMQLHGVPAGGGVIAGLHVGNFEMRASYKYHIQDRDGGKTCMALQAINITFQTEPVIFVASNFPKGSCAYNYILAHELTHEKITRSVQRKYSRKAQKEIRAFIQRFDASAPVSSGRIDVIQQRINEQIDRRIDELAREAMKVLENRQSTIDTPGAYQKGDNEIIECMRKEEIDARRKAKAKGEVPTTPQLLHQ